MNGLGVPPATGTMNEDIPRVKTTLEPSGVKVGALFIPPS
jgi:hypothetical protein